MGHVVQKIDVYFMVGSGMFTLYARQASASVILANESRGSGRDGAS